jgi:hypothetical protein
MPWGKQQIVTVEKALHPDAQRLTDLSLALIIPWRDGFPQYWLARDGSNAPQRMREILDATECERLPWQL